MIPITVEDIMERLNCSEQRARLFFKWYGDNQEKIQRELAIQEHKQRTTPAMIINNHEENVMLVN